MQDHIRDLQSCFQYSDQLKETAVFRKVYMKGQPAREPGQFG